MKAGMVVFATSPPDDEGVKEARAWVKARNLTAEDVALKRGDGVVRVVLRRPVDLKAPSSRNA